MRKLKLRSPSQQAAEGRLEGDDNYNVRGEGRTMTQLLTPPPHPQKATEGEKNGQTPLKELRERAGTKKHEQL